jgi:steroid delta-isomerase
MTAAVHTYVEGFAKSDAALIIDMYAADASLEDPIGTPVRHGIDSIAEFYVGAMHTGARLELHEPVRIAADYAAFAFTVVLDLGEGLKRVDVIDTFRFNADNKITEMRAFWGPTNMSGF